MGLLAREVGLPERALGEKGDDPVDAELRRLLEHPEHPLAIEDRLKQDEGERRFGGGRRLERRRARGNPGDAAGWDGVQQASAPPSARRISNRERLSGSHQAEAQAFLIHAGDGPGLPGRQPLGSRYGLVQWG
jgi:hypothetical protein